MKDWNKNGSEEKNWSNQSNGDARKVAQQIMEDMNKGLKEMNQVEMKCSEGAGIDGSTLGRIQQKIKEAGEMIHQACDACCSKKDGYSQKEGNKFK
jgi:mannitol-specific phosphotransferase system IIBC component